MSAKKIMATAGFGAAVCILLAANNAKANLLQNGNFGTGSFADWTVSQSINNDVRVSTLLPEPGANVSAILGPYPTPVVVSQTIATQVGQRYDFSFYLTTGGGSPGPGAGVNSAFTASFGGDQVLDSVNTTISGWQFESYVVLATNSSTTVQFTSLAPGAADYYLGDVDIDGVPDGGATLLMFALAIPALLVIPRKLKNQI